jgi:pimeloyl-ACP methyl ester carboxylesterase
MKGSTAVIRFKVLVRSVLAISLALPLAPAAAAAVAIPAKAPLSWAPCHTLVKDWNAEDTRSECTRVAVPLDYAKPGGRTIRLMVSRIKATSATKRQGVVMINPGGPGVPGLSWPHILSQSTVAGIGIDHDLIGFDPRGTGRSGAVACKPIPDDGRIPAAADLPAVYRQKALYRQIYDRQARYNARCLGKDAAFIASMSTTVIAKDLDRIRIALGEPKISYYGISWGTALGAEYRSLYDNHVDRMLLDSVMPPDSNVGTLYDGMMGALRSDLLDFSEWVAARDSQYHLGATGAAVADTVTALVRSLDAHPRTITAPGREPVKVNGDNLRRIVTSTEQDSWPDGARSIAALRDGGIPPLLEEEIYDGDSFINSEFAQIAVMCNDQGSAPRMQALWRRIQQQRVSDPLFGGEANFEHWCAGWPLPAQRWHLKAGTSALQLVGHREEETTPYGFALDMRQRIGGELLTVEDDQHGSLNRIPCGNKAVRFFSTGHTDNGTCPGADPAGGVVARTPASVAAATTSITGTTRTALRFR